MSARHAPAPLFDCPIPPRISPYADVVHDWLVDWVCRCGLPLDDAARRTFEGGAFASYAARLYPDADLADLQVVTGLFAWFFLLDDAADSSRTPEVARLRGLLRGVLSVLGDGPGVPSMTFRGPLRRMLVDAWRVPGTRMPAGWRTRFVGTVRHHLQGVLTEAENKAAGRVPTVAGYVELRRATSAAYVSYALGEFVAGAPLPDPVLRHPAVRAYGAAGNDLLSWFNDLLSLDRDAATSGGHNLVLALAAERALPVADAVPAAVELWRTRMDDFVGLRAAVPSFGPAVDRALERHLDGVGHAVRGTIDWSLGSARYRPSPLVAAYL
jgi:hypothetical protein